MRFLLAAGAPTTLVHSKGMIDSEWHHLVVTVDRGGNATLYIDGEYADARDITAHTQAVKNVFWIGDCYGGKGVEGLIDSVYIFKGALSDEQVRTLYKK